MEAANPERIDVNAAPARELALLPGVDRLLARQIVLSRKIYGPFQRVEDLLRVDGVSARLLAEIIDRIAVDTELDDDEDGALEIHRHRAAGGVPESTGDEPALFSGSGGFLRGTITLRNSGKRTLHAQALLVENTDVRGAGGTSIPPVRLPFPIPPGEHRTVTATLAIDPTTPPGEHRAELVAGHERLPILLIVQALHSVALRPSRITMVNEPGSHHEFEVVIENRGNVRLVVEDIGVVPVEDVDLCRVVRETVRRTDHPTWDELVGTATDQLKKTFANFEALRVRTRNKPVTIDPGASELLHLDVRIPKNLPRKRQFRARARVFDSTLFLDVQPWVEPEQEDDGER